MYEDTEELEMASRSLDEIEELTVCSCCGRPFDEAERAPKVLACKHHFCLECARGVLAGAGAGAGDVCCAHCWKRTAPPAGRAERLPTHAALLALARHLAAARAALPAPPGPPGPPAAPEPHADAAREARALLQRETRLLRADLQRLAARQRDFLLRALDAATELKVRLEAELAAPPPPAPPPPARPAPASLLAAAAERDRLRARHAEMTLQCRLDDLIRDAAAPLDFDLMRRALAGLGAGEPPPPPPSPPEDRRDAVLFLVNYCTAQLYTRHCLEKRARLPNGAPDGLPNGDAGGSPARSPGGGGAALGAVGSPLVRNPSAYPLFYFNLEVNGAPFGRVEIEVRDDAAPRMARNFTVLATGELGVGYRGCAVFQCWENESVITGDYELNNGRGGRSVFEESYFMPDDTKMAAVRGAVGMRRSQKRHDNLGLVGSQFRIMLREMRGFTAIFAFVVEGLELVDRLSRTGDSAGKPHSFIVIAGCGKLN